MIEPSDGGAVIPVVVVAGIVASVVHTGEVGLYDSDMVVTEQDLH